MSWIRVDDQAPSHPKFLAAGPTASWLWLCGQGYCARYLTDGFIPACALPTFAIVGVEEQATILVRVGLWEQTEGGYRVHDYLEYQPSKADVLERRRQDAERKRGGHPPDSNGNPGGIPAESNQPPRVRARDPIPSHPVPIPEEKEPAAAPAAPLTLRPFPKPKKQVREPPNPEVKQFLEWFASTYPAYSNDSPYAVNWGRHGADVKALLATFPLDRLKQMAVVLLTTDDAWVAKTDRGIDILRSQANGLARRLAAYEAKHGPVEVPA